MMPPKPVAAKAGAMKQKWNSKRFTFFGANIVMHCWERTKCLQSTTNPLSLKLSLNELGSSQSCLLSLV